MGASLKGGFGSHEIAGSGTRVRIVQDGFVPKVALFELKHLTPINQGEKKALVNRETGQLAVRPRRSQPRELRTGGRQGHRRPRRGRRAGCRSPEMTQANN